MAVQVRIRRGGHRPPRFTLWACPECGTDYRTPIPAVAVWVPHDCQKLRPGVAGRMKGVRR